MLTPDVLPDPATCLTRHHDGALWACLVDEPERCPYLFRLNRMYCCRHENRSAFLEPAERKLRSFREQHLCHTRHYVGDHYECIAERPGQCPHAFSFGFSYFCRHPDRGAFSDGNGQLIQM